MKVLITGITGFVGSHLAEYILEEHSFVQVYGLKRWRSPRSNILGIFDEINLWNGDLRDLKSMELVIAGIKPDVIFHLAAQSYVPTSFDAPNDTLETNIIGTVNLLEAVRSAKIDPIIHICSSSEVYGQVKPEDIPIDENTPLRPSSPYAVSKVGEDMVAYQYHVSYGMKTIRTRMFTHTGPRRGHVFVVSAFARQIAMIEHGLQDPIIKVGNLESVRTFADVRDAVRAYWLLIEKCKPGEVYNIGGNITMKIGEMLEILLDLSSYEDSISVEVCKELLRPSDVTLQIPDISKFVNETDWEPNIPFEKTLKDTLDYWRKKISLRKEYQG